MVFPILLVQFVKYSSNHRVHKRGDGFYHGRKTVSFYLQRITFFHIHINEGINQYGHRSKNALFHGWMLCTK